MSERRHDPTPARLREAQRQGDVAVSYDLLHAASLLGSVVAIGALSTPLAVAVAKMAIAQFRGAAAPLADGVLPAGLLLDVVSAALPMLAAMSVMGWFSGGMQRGFRFSSSRLGVNWQRLNPQANLQRIGGDAGVHVLGWLKAILLASLVAVMIWHETPLMVGLGGMAPLPLTITLTGMTLRLATTLSIALLVVGALDYIWQRWRYRRRMRMTDEELRREQRQ